MQLSNYIFISKPIHNNKYCVVYSTMTSKSYLISSEVCDKLVDNHFNSIDINTLGFLKKEDIIVESREKEFNKFRERIFNSDNIRDQLYVVILPTSRCQFNCSYCGQRHGNTTISPETIDKLVSRISHKLINNNFKHLSVGWFGGEPLFALDEIDQITQALNKVLVQHKISYSSSMVTNGFDLNLSTFTRLVKLGVTKFEITLDGDEKTHNRRRNINAEENSFNVIIDNISKVVHSNIFETNNNIKIVVRCNIDQNNKFSWKELICRLEKFDILKKLASFYIAPIHSWGNNAHKSAINVEEFADIELEFFTTLLLKGCRFNFLESAKRRTCMAVSRHDEVYDMSGNIYNCTEAPLVDGYADSYTINPRKEDERKFHDWYNLLFNSKCKGCKILPLCLGVCPKQSEEGTVVCPSIKYNIKKVILLHYYQNKGQK